MFRYTTYVFHIVCQSIVSGSGTEWGSVGLCRYHHFDIGMAPILNGNKTYRQVSNIIRPKFQHLKDFRTVLWLSLPNPLKPDVKSRMKM